jgi:hypothetical protein
MIFAKRGRDLLIVLRVLCCMKWNSLQEVKVGLVGLGKEILLLRLVFILHSVRMRKTAVKSEKKKIIFCDFPILKI